MRRLALVELVTGHILSSHFEQIVLVSHGGAWSPALFAYHVFIDGGEVVESNLPAVATELPVAYEVANATYALSEVSYS